MTAYATKDELARLSAMSPGAAAALGDTVVEAELEATSRMVDTYLQARVSVPLATWGAEVTQCVCDIAGERLQAKHGFNPQAYAPGPDSDAHITARAKRALAWLRDVASGRASLGPGTAPSEPGGGSYGLVRIRSSEPRGW